MDNEIYLGEKVKDKVTGLVGIVVAKCTYLNNCVQFLIQPKAVDHRIVEGYWIDESQLIIVSKKDTNLACLGHIADGGGVRAHPRGQ